MMCLFFLSYIYHLVYKSSASPIVRISIPDHAAKVTPIGSIGNNLKKTLVNPNSIDNTNQSTYGAHNNYYVLTNIYEYIHLYVVNECIVFD